MRLCDVACYEEYGQKKDNVDVSVFCITYNHKDYIKKTFEGFLMQKTNFTVEVLVYDDASTDGTSDIVREYAEKYPELFHAFISKTNLYHHPEFTSILQSLEDENLTGKYFAACEGDDYWIYENKLQRQYDFMEANSDVTMCVHNAIRYNETDGEVIPQVMDMDSGCVDDDELIWCHHGRIPTASFFYRSDVCKSKPHFFEICPVGDDPLRWWSGYLGKVYYFDKVWSVRSYMHEGSWNKNMATDRDFKHQLQYRYLKFLVEFNDETKMRFNSQIMRVIAYYCYEELNLLKDEDEWSVQSFIKAIEDVKRINDHEFDSIFDILKISLMRECVDYEKPLINHIKDNNKMIYIYGAGEVAENKASFFIQNGIKWESFIVTKIGEKKELMSHDIISVDDLKDKDAYIYLGMNLYNRMEVIPELIKRGFINII